MQSGVASGMTCYLISVILDSETLYYKHPNTESSCLKLTSRRSLSQSKGRAKKMPRHPKQRIIPNSAISHPKLCQWSSPTLPIVIPNSANSHPELDSGSLYYLHPNAESSCLKLTTMRSLSPVEGWSLSQSKGRAKKNAPSSRIRFGFVKADGRAYTDAKSSSHDGVLSAKKSHHSVKSFRKENMYSDW